MKQKAQALVEFAIIFPIMVILIFGSIHIHKLILERHRAEMVAYEGAKMASDYTNGEISSYLRSQISDVKNIVVVKNGATFYVEFDTDDFHVKSVEIPQKRLDKQ